MFQKVGAATGDKLGFSVSSAGDVSENWKADFIIDAPDATSDGRFKAGPVDVYSGAYGSVLFRKGATMSGLSFTIRR